VAGTSTIPGYIPIADGKPNICENANTVTINAANNNNNLWVPITDTNSNVVAEINANGNDLGNVTTELYINSGPVREYGFNKVLYLDRNLTITPQNQPSSAVDIRLYINNTEFTALQTATNSIGQPSGVSTIASLGIYKNNDPCSAAIISTPAPVTVNLRAVQGSYGYALQGSINSFSSFYFASITAALPLKLLSFTGQLKNHAAWLQWITEEEQGTKTFTIERSINGLDFGSIGNVAALNSNTKQNYQYNDTTLYSLTVPVVYYRLKIIDADGKFSYSGIVKLNLASIKGTISVHPNPVVNNVTVEINATATENANWVLTDITGKTVMQNKIELNKGENSININLTHLPAGMYYLKVVGNNINQGLKLQKL
jgi:trimeric autotransporter adhesin